MLYLHWCIFLLLHWFLQMQCYKKCSHFVWLDEEMNPKANEVISSSLQNLNDEKQKVKYAMMKDEEMKMKMELLNKHLKLNSMINIVVLIAYVVVNNNEIGS